MRIFAAALVFLALCVPAAAADLAPDPENTLYLDLDSGRVVIRMRPDLAPNHVARIKHLVRGGFYDGMVFHRVLAGFMAQTGDPKGDGTGGSGRLLKAEFTRTAQGRGAVSMARTSNKDSADSQFFIVFSDANRSALDGKYTMWGEVTAGMEFVDGIKKGDSARNGAVLKPDKLVRLQVAADADRGAAPAVDLKSAETLAAARDFSGGEFRCSALASGNTQAALAPVWTHGFLVGAYKAQNKLTFAGADDSVKSAVQDACARHPEAFLLTAAAQDLAKTARDIPAQTPTFPASTYTCMDYVAARSAKAPEADLADMWAFAVIQGYKNVGQPDLEFPFESKAQLLGIVNTTCAKNPNTTLLDLTALVAAKVKLQ